ncbi:hypothetical protein [Microvirga rosea]|uniref:hypothetical protein n=1 Tax=Microvirga rosea TaxID=2715425 RepID=UPI001D0B2C9E|nr:hypothetical protein [Microvirga rosea]MCB8821670.1 hypothetical protein [Microvirga rosea]
MAVSASILKVIEGLSPISRLRVLAFLHLLENPKILKTSLEVDPSGDLRLILTAGDQPVQRASH